MKVLAVFGTRPEAIKMIPVVQELKRRSEDWAIETLVCVTAQHREMLDQVLHLFNISTDYDLDLMQANQTPTRLAASALWSLEPILQQERPDWVIVQGDTTTAAAVSLAAFYAEIQVAHVEAGLRTHVKREPFPEETNRRITGVIADLHFAPTRQAQDNLLREGIPRECVLVTGNPVIDALRQASELAMPSEIEVLLRMISSQYQNGKQKLILVTAHRRENFGTRLDNICLGLRELAHRYHGQAHFIYPVHLNPNVQEPVRRILDGVRNITLLPPLDYRSLVHLMKHSYLVLTDSGGIQEEAPALGKPVLVLRDVTERPEAVQAGTVKLIGTDQKRIVNEVSFLLENTSEYQRMARAINPYGDGRASQRIVDALLGDPVTPFDPARDTAAWLMTASTTNAATISAEPDDRP